MGFSYPSDPRHIPSARSHAAFRRRFELIENVFAGLFGWKPIASYEEVQSARRAVWGARLVATTATARMEDEEDAGRPAGNDLWPGRRLQYLARRAARRNGASGHNHRRPVVTAQAEDQGGARPQGSSGTAAQQVPAMAKYLSTEWVEAGRRRVEGHPDFREQTAGVHASILCVVHEQPEHADEVFYIDFRDGRIIDIYSGPKAEFDTRGAMPMFEVHGDYNTFMQIQEGHMSQTTALMRGRLRLKGSLLKAMKHMRALETVTRILREVPTEY